MKDVIEDVKHAVKKYNYTKIYVATEEKALFEKFEKAFPGMIL